MKIGRIIDTEKDISNTKNWLERNSDDLIKEENYIEDVDGNKVLNYIKYSSIKENEEFYEIFEYDSFYNLIKKIYSKKLIGE